MKTMIKGLKRIVRYGKRLISRHAFLRKCAKAKKQNRIVVVTHASNKTGAPILALNIVRELAKTADVAVLTLSIGELDEQFRSCSIAYGSFPSRKLFLRLSRLGFSSVLVNSVGSISVLPLATGAGLRVCTLVHELPNTIKAMGLAQSAALLRDYSHVCVFPAVFTYRRFIDAFGSIDPPCQVIIKPQGLYNASLLQSDRADARLKTVEALSLPPNKDYLLCVGTGDERKGIDIFLSLAQLLKPHPRFHLIWVGPVEPMWLAQMLAEPNITHIQYIDDKTILGHLYSSALFYLMISREEPFGSVVLESCACHTPVIAFENAGGYLDIIKDKETGLLVPYLDITALRNAILRAADDSSLREAIAERAESIVRQMVFPAYVQTLRDALREGDKATGEKQGL